VEAAKVHTTGSFEFQFWGVQPFHPLHHCFALFGLKEMDQKSKAVQKERGR